MKTFIAILALILFTHTPLGTAHAADTVSVGNITVSNAWSRASTGANRPSGAFLSVANKGSASDRLIGVQSPAAAKSALHNSVMEDGVMKMNHVMAIDIPAGGMTMLKPGGFHIMLMGVTTLLKEGDMFPVTLTFEKAGKVLIMVHVGKAGAMMPMVHN